MSLGSKWLGVDHIHHEYHSLGLISIYLGDIAMPGITMYTVLHHVYFYPPCILLSTMPSYHLLHAQADRCPPWRRERSFLSLGCARGSDSVTPTLIGHFESSLVLRAREGSSNTQQHPYQISELLPGILGNRRLKLLGCTCSRPVATKPGHFLGRWETQHPHHHITMEHLN